MICPACRYVMGAFDKECPRCHGKGMAPPVPPSSVPLPTVASPAPSSTVPLPQNNGLVKCPYCAEDIQPNAQKCRYCGEWLAGHPAQNPVVPAPRGSNPMAPSYLSEGVGLALAQPQPRKIDSFLEWKTWPVWIQLSLAGGLVFVFALALWKPELTGSPLVFTVALPLGIAYGIDGAKQKQQIAQTFGQFEGFSATQRYLAHWNRTGIALDERAHQVCLLDVRQRYIHQLLLCPQDVVHCEVVEDNHSSVTQDSGCALAGCLLLGLPGLLIGGLTGLKRTTTRVKKIDLKITVNDISKPNHIVNFLQGDTSHGTSLYKNARGQAEHWHALISVLMKHG